MLTLHKWWFLYGFIVFVLKSFKSFKKYCEWFTLALEIKNHTRFSFVEHFSLSIIHNFQFFVSSRLVKGSEKIKLNVLQSEAQQQHQTWHQKNDFIITLKWKRIQSIKFQKCPVMFLFRSTLIFPNALNVRIFSLILHVKNGN